MHSTLAESPIGRTLAAARLLLIVATLALFARPALAADPRAFTDGLGNEVIGILKVHDMAMPEREHRFRELFTRNFDAPAIGRFVLGTYWQKTSPDEQKRYLDLFSDYVAAIYAVQFSGYQGETFKTIDTQPITGGDAAVRAEIARPEKPPLHIVFRVRPGGEGYKIVDVSVEGVSLIITKREEFASVLGKEGLGGVMTRMQTVVKNTTAAAARAQSDG
jgi:phospholipid transport system substrate-binding protein